MRKPLRSVTSPGPSALHVPISQAALHPPVLAARKSICCDAAGAFAHCRAHAPANPSPLWHIQLGALRPEVACQARASSGRRFQEWRIHAGTIKELFGNRLQGIRGKKKEALTIDTSAAPPLPSEPSPNASQPSPSNRRPTISGSLASRKRERATDAFDGSVDLRVKGINELVVLRPSAHVCPQRQTF